MNQPLVIVLAPVQPSSGARGHQVIACADDVLAAHAAASLVLASGCQFALSILGSDGEYRWVATPFSDRSAKREAA